jgi:Protein of unknown function (DUF3995)
MFDGADCAANPIGFGEPGGRRHRLSIFSLGTPYGSVRKRTIRYRMEDFEGPMIRNVHQRNLRANINNAAALLHRLSSESDQLWPKDRWPAMKLSSGLGEGSYGGHGFVRYSVASVDPHRVVFRFDDRIGLRGTHSFELEESPGGGCVLRHVLEGDSLGWTRIAWPLIVKPLHDALVEDGLDNAVRELDGERLEKRPLTRRVKFLRRGLSLISQQPVTALHSRRLVGDVAAVALAGIGVLHTVWGAGLTTWPGEDLRSLAEKVVGGSVFPSPVACYVVAALLGTASGLLALRSRATDPKTFLLAHVGTNIVGIVLAFRGAAGMLVSAFGMLNETAEFRRANLLLYSPLCLALAAGTLWSSRKPVAK